VLSANTSWYLHNYRIATIRAFQQKGYQVLCLSPLDDYSARLAKLPGTQHLDLPMDNQGNNPARDLLLLLRFLRFYRREKPVAVFHFTIKNNVYGTLAAALAGCPAINNISGLGSAFIHSSWVSRVVRLLYRVSQPLAYRIFCQNAEDFALLTENRLVPADKLQRLPGSGVDLERFRPLERNRPERPFRFLFLGRMLADKGLRELVQAQCELAGKYDCELWLAGFSEARNNSAIPEAELQSWSGKHGVRWLGASDDPGTLIAQADCLVLPSYREGLPRSLLEAGAMAVPVIATDVAGCRDVVRDGHNGLLCQPRDVQSLAGAMRRMVELPASARAAMGRAGRETVEEHFSERIVLDQYCRVLDEVANR
jgi:glycosyltransferase involved in cell wall biosynthesis